jgi:uncharacterized coiled-coil protein SlyX
MSKTPEQVLREIVAEQIFQIAQLASQVNNLTEELQKYKSVEETKTDGNKQDI